MSEDNQTHILQPTYPIRMLTNGWIDALEAREYYRLWTMLKPINQDAPSHASFTLKSTFTETSNPVFSTALFQKASEIMQYNSQTHETSYISRHTYNEDMMYILRNDIEAFAKIISHHGTDFMAWHDYADHEAKKINQDAIGQLPEVSTKDFAPAVRACSISPISGPNASSKILLPVDATRLFNAIVLAENTGAAIDVSMDHNDLSAPAKLSVKATRVSPSEKNKKLQIR